jgi:hypothetical protein
VIFDINAEVTVETATVGANAQNLSNRTITLNNNNFNYFLKRHVSP